MSLCGNAKTINFSCLSHWFDKRMQL